MTTAVAAVLRARRTIHDFVPGSAPPPDLVRDAIAHAVLAPNHYRTRPWRFYLPGPEGIEQICRINAELVRATKGDAAAENKLKRWRDVPGWMVLTCARSADPVRAREDYAACCCAAQNFSLFLWEQGYGVKWTTGDVIRERAFAGVLGISAGSEDVVGLFWFGRAAAVPERPGGDDIPPLITTP